MAMNEQDNIEEAIKKAHSIAKKIAKEFEILVVYSERSTDNTETIIKANMSNYPELKIIYQPKNKPGYGVALRLGIQNAQYEYIFYTDGDNQFDIKELESFLPFLKSYDIINGKRKKRQDTLARKTYAFIYNIFVDIVFFVNFIDIDCAFKLYKKKIFKDMHLHSDSGFIDAEILVKAKKRGFKIKTLPVTHLPRKGGESVTEGSFWHKIKIAKDLFRDLWEVRKNVKQ